MLYFIVINTDLQGKRQIRDSLAFDTDFLFVRLFISLAWSCIKNILTFMNTDQ